MTRLEELTVRNTTSAGTYGAMPNLTPSAAWNDNINHFLARALHMHTLHVHGLTYAEHLRSDTVQHFICEAMANDLTVAPRFLQGFPSLKGVSFRRISLSDGLDRELTPVGSMEQWAARLDQKYLPCLQQEQPATITAFHSGFLQLSPNFTLRGVYLHMEYNNWFVHEDLPGGRNACACVLDALMQQGLNSAAVHVTRLRLEATYLTHGMVDLLARSFVSAIHVYVDMNDVTERASDELCLHGCVLQDDKVLAQLVLDMPCLSALFVVGSRLSKSLRACLEFAQFERQRQGRNVHVSYIR